MGNGILPPQNKSVSPDAALPLGEPPTDDSGVVDPMNGGRVAMVTKPFTHH